MPVQLISSFMISLSTHFLVSHSGVHTFSNYIISNILKKTLKEYIFHYEGWALSSNWYMIFNLVHDNITIWFTDCHNKINIIIFCKYMLFLYFLKIPALPDNKQESALTSLLDLGLFYFFTHQMINVIVTGVLHCLVLH